MLQAKDSTFAQFSPPKSRNIFCVSANRTSRCRRDDKKLPEIPEMIEQTPLDILIDKQKKEHQELFKKNLPELLNQLGVQERMVVKMKYFKDFNISQISQNLKITRYEIEKTLSSSLEFLKEKIKEICK